MVTKDKTKTKTKASTTTWEAQPVSTMVTSKAKSMLSPLITTKEPITVTNLETRCTSNKTNKVSTIATMVKSRLLWLMLMVECKSDLTLVAWRPFMLMIKVKPGIPTMVKDTIWVVNRVNNRCKVVHNLASNNSRVKANNNSKVKVNKTKAKETKVSKTK
jgi:hypothetical protein